MSILSKAIKYGAEAVICAVAPPLAPAIIIKETASFAVRVAVQSDGGDPDNAKEAENTVRTIFSVGSIAENIFGND
jgi:hypothetical protein